ncbi:enoyl ACP reductase FabMG family protein [Pararhodobacter sp.]|uniref:enoyl ACP reductase FabMG family protein n=1 Tax=Pararhodobacter sp. TaxID=2127056 RepID=UPI002FDCAEDC
MNRPTPQKTTSNNTLFRGGDVFVLFGELFGRGYATGLVDQARKAGMKIVGITVGRRDENNNLRALTAEELAAAEENLGGTIINQPLMAGFDLDAPEGQPTPTDLLNRMTVESWKGDKLDWDHIEACRQRGVTRFKDTLGRVMGTLDGMIPDGRNVIFAHTMAGGIPKAKAFLVIANRIYKGRGARHMSSQDLIESDLGKMLLQNFDEVSANTFQHLIEASAPIRDRIKATGGQVRYIAYGYHGTEVLIGDDYRWQTYTNYTQGYAKMRLERIATAAWADGVKATVFNCPEIRTNSSDVFAGIELSLLPLLRALKKEGGGAWVDALWQECEALLKNGVTLDDLLQKIADYQNHEAMQRYYDFASWPLPNSAEQAEQTIGTSAEIVQLHKDTKVLVSDVLSYHVVTATGQLIFSEASSPSGPVLWLNHDRVARSLLANV